MLSRKLFPVLDGIGKHREWRDDLLRAPGVAAMLKARADRLAACNTDLICLTQAMIWSSGEEDVLAAAAPDAAKGGDPAQEAPSAAIRRELEGVNVILRTYGLGAVPAYPLIDGPGTIDPAEQQARLKAAAWLAQTPRGGSAQAIDPSVDFALALLDGSDRTDAISFEPLDGGENALAMARARHLDWGRWRYSAMIVTGVGPEVEGMPLSPMGKYHLRLAAQRFAQGDVPFIIVSGGHAHPRGTPFAEAEQMRKALIERYGIPADAIVIEPYARHTTTNLRDATRVLQLMHAPLDKETVVVCNPGQSSYIGSPAFVDRNEKELGYQPGKVVRRISPTEVVFVPSADSARMDPRDPLDP